MVYKFNPTVTCSVCGCQVTGSPYGMDYIIRRHRNPAGVACEASGTRGHLPVGEGWVPRKVAS